MRIRTLSAVVATAAVSAAVFGALNVAGQINPGVEATPERCTPPKGSGLRLTRMSNTEGRVWLRETVRDNIATRKYYACSNSFRKHIYLATTKHQDVTDEGETPPFSSMHVGEQALDQVAVAFVKTTCNPAGENAKCTHVLRWVRLRDGKVVREFKSAGPERPTTPVIDADALMFWIVDTDNSTGPECGPNPCELRMAGVRGDRTIDTGTSMSGLGRAGLTVYWRKGDDVRGLNVGGEPPDTLD